MSNIKIRYRVDPYRNAIVDQDEGMLVCGGAEALQYFNKKKSKTRTLIRELDAKINALELAKIQLQSQCQHKNAVAEYKSDTGNWCKADDSYWIDFRCYDCGKTWSEEQ